MYKYLLFFSLITLLGCPGPKPSPQPSPTPVVSPTVFPSPTVKPSPSEKPSPSATPSTTPKPLKDMTKIIQLGMWAAMNSSKRDMKLYQDSLGPTKYNYTSVHLMSPWGNYEGLYPWPLAAGGTKYDLSKRNPDYYLQLENYIRNAVMNGMGIEVCFFDSYGTVKWRQYRGYGKKLHPLVENTYGINLVGSSSNPIYDNWKRTGFSDKDFNWMAWTADAHDHVLSAHGANKVGVAMMDYIQQVAALFGKYEKLYPGHVHVSVREINEPNSFVDSSGKYIAGSGTGDDSRVEDWIMQQFQSQGLKLNKNLIMVHEGAVKYQNAAGADCYSCLKRNVDYSRNQGWKYEEHGCDVTKGKAMIAAGIDKTIMACSTDGVSDHVISSISHDLLNLGYTRTEIKMSDDWVGTYHANDPNGDFLRALPFAIQAVK